MDNDERVIESDHENIPNDKTLNVYKKTDKEDTGVLIAVGKTFSSFADLERAITLFEERNFVKFWIREARTIEAAKKRIDRHINPKMKYYELKYTCIHGGQKFRSKGEGNTDAS